MLKKKIYQSLVNGNIGIEVQTEQEQRILINYLLVRGFGYKQGFNMEFIPNEPNIYFLDNNEIHMLKYLSKIDRELMLVHEFHKVLKKESYRFVPIETVHKSIENKDNTMFIQFLTEKETKFDVNRYLESYSNVVQITISLDEDKTWDDYEVMVSTFNTVHKMMASDSSGRAVRLSKSPGVIFTKEQYQLIKFFMDTLDHFQVN